jgi:tetratricopeptide (TPR) repeat protein
MSTLAAEMMEEADRARREHRLADARRDFAEALVLCRRTGERQDLLRALKGLGQIERDLGRVAAARPLYEEAVALCRETEDPLVLAHTVRHLGDIHRDAARMDLAEPCYQEALALYRSTERTATLDLANAVRPLAILKEAVGSTEEARQLWREARDLYTVAAVEEGAVECSQRLDRLSR